MNNTSQIFRRQSRKLSKRPSFAGKGIAAGGRSFDWFVANHVNIYAVLEGKYDGPAATPTNRNGGNNPKQQRALSLMRNEPGGSWYLTGAYGNGKTHLLFAHYREIVISGKVRCHVRTTRELVEELRRAEFDEEFVSPVLAAASKPSPYHLFWDDIDKLKMTDFKTEVLFDLVDSLYRQKHGLTVTGNYSMRDLVEHERMHPAIVRRLDDMCRVLEV